MPQTGKKEEEDRFASRELGRSINREEARPLMEVLKEKHHTASDESALENAAPSAVELFSEKDRSGLEALFYSVLNGSSGHSTNGTVNAQSETINAPAQFGQKWFIKPEERPFARLASVISKFPWHAHPASPLEVDRLFCCLQCRPPSDAVMEQC